MKFNPFVVFIVETGHALSLPYVRLFESHILLLASFAHFDSAQCELGVLRSNKVNEVWVFVETQNFASLMLNRPYTGKTIAPIFISFVIIPLLFDFISTLQVWYYYPGACGTPAPHKK